MKRPLTIMLGLLVASAKVAAATATGTVFVSIIAPVAVMSSTGLLSSLVVSSTGWVSIVIPRAGMANFQPLAFSGTSNASGTTNATSATDSTNPSDAGAAAVDAKPDNAIQLEDQALTPGVIDLPASDGTLSSSLATSIVVSGLTPGNYSATVSFN